MLVFQITFLLALLCVCSVGPGFFFVRRLRWNPLEKLCGSIGLSLVFLYATAFATYLLKLDRWAYYVVSLCCLGMAVAARRDLIGLFRATSVRCAVKRFVFLWAWTFALLMLIRHYSGGGWGGDWAEHCQRVMFFLGDWPEGKLFTSIYKVPARPPMMNAVAAHFLGQLGALRFETYQAVFAFLNLLAFLPCCLMIGEMARRGRRQLLVLCGLFALNPVFVENVTYAWTKLFAGFYIILAIWFYLAALRKNDLVRMTAAFLAISAGFLVHYSAGPYAAFLGLHYVLWAWWRRPDKLKELAVAGGLSAILLASWFGWATAAYGVNDTFASNTTVTGMTGYSAEGNVAKFLKNVINTLVPHPLRQVAGLGAIVRGDSAWGYVRDYMFLIYQVNLVFGMGSIGGLLVVYLLVRTLIAGPGKSYATNRPGTGNKQRRMKEPRRRKTISERLFWLLFVPFCASLGIAVVGPPDEFGLSHACLQPMVLLGLTLLGGYLYRLPVLLRWAAVLGLRADFYLGVLLQHYLEHAEFTVSVRDGRIIPSVVDAPALSIIAVNNWYAKYAAGLTYLGDHVGQCWPAILVGIVVAFEILIGLMLLKIMRKSHDLSPELFNG